MNKWGLLLIFSMISFVAKSQVDAKYLKGAVQEVNNKVVFEKTIKVEADITEAALLDLMGKWAEKCYPDDGARKRVYISPKDNRVACLGDQRLIFTNNFMSRDMATMKYQLILDISKGQCNALVRNISYDYEGQVLTAENMITDKVALNKTGDKMNRYSEKFRVFTIDSISGIFNSIDIYLNGTKAVIGTAGAANAATVQPKGQQNIVQPATVAQVASNVVTPIKESIQQPSINETVASSAQGVAASVLEGYKNISADKIPGNIIRLLEDAILITSGAGDQVNVMAASWGGLGRFWERPVAFSFLNPTRYSVTTMDQGDVYTISFYTQAYKDAIQYCGSHSGRDTDKIKGSGLTPIKTPSGAIAFSEAWMILECKKLLVQPISIDAVKDKETGKQWSKDGYHKMYIGEVLNVWVK